MARFYRQLVKPAGLVQCSVKIEETDLQILAEKDVSPQASKIVNHARSEISGFINRYPEFSRSLIPVKVPPDAPQPVRMMDDAGRAAGVGPMAAVAGTIAELVGKGLADLSHEIIVENGGDIFLRSTHARVVAVFAGSSPISMKIGLNIDPAPRGVGVCTSSATVGHSLSMGKADAVVVVARNAALADAVATATCNRVTLPSSLEPALQFATGIKDVMGAVIVLGKNLAAAGKGFEITDLS